MDGSAAALLTLAHGMFGEPWGDGVEDEDLPDPSDPALAPRVMSLWGPLRRSCDDVEKIEGGVAAGAGAGAAAGAGAEAGAAAGGGGTGAGAGPGPVSGLKLTAPLAQCTVPGVRAWAEDAAAFYANGKA